MVDRKVVSDLGPETSITWAQTERKRSEFTQLLAPNPLDLKETTVSQYPATDLLFGMQETNQTWSTFRAPEGFFEQARSRSSLFSSSVIPSIGSIEETVTKGDQLAGLPEGEGKLAIKNLFAVLSNLNANLSFATTRVQQYKKG